MLSTPTPDYAPKVQHIGPHFAKIFLKDKWEPFHILYAPDTGPPHSHPFSFLAHVMLGGYIEDVYTTHGDGSWSVETIERRPGTSHRVEAGTIHLIRELPLGFSITWAEPDDAPKQDWHHFDFREDGVYRSPNWDGPWEKV